MVHAHTTTVSSGMIVMTEASDHPMTAAHTFHVEGLQDALRVKHFEGEEKLSQLFRFDITVLCETRDLDFPEIVGKRAELMVRLGEAPRRIQGIVESFQQEDEGKALTAYRAVLVPEARRLELRRNSRIFQAMSVPEILEKVLKTAGIQGSRLRFAFSKRYPQREYCVQYRESDWAFLSRLMEVEGIHYFFEHPEGGGGGVLVVADSASAHEAIAGERGRGSRRSQRDPQGGDAASGRDSGRVDAGDGEISARRFRQD